MRKEYVCGGVWFGRQIEFRDIVKKIENLRFRDLDIRLGLPIWHDESYLNKWASENNFNLLSSSFCFNTEYPWIKHLKPVIIAVDKHSQLLN
jgi:hypothetical protein